MTADVRHTWYFEDFEVGHTTTTMGRTVTEADLVNFVGFGGLFEEIFVNAEYAKRATIFEARVVPAMLILTVAEGLYIQSGHTHNGRAFLGLDGLRLVAPVVCGDTVSVDVTVQSARASNSRPDHGIVVLDHRVRNQRDDDVMTYQTTRLIAGRGAPRDT